MNVRPDHRPVDRRHNEHRKRASFKTLLVFHILVTGKKHIKAFVLDQMEKGTVFDAAPLHTDDGVNVMPGQERGELARHIFIEKHLQRCA